MKNQIIEPNVDEEFLIARVGIPQKFFKSFQCVSIPVGYNLFYVINSEWKPYNNQVADQKIDFKRFLKDIKANKVTCITLYWIIQNHEIIVPWGIEKSNNHNGYNGILRFTINNDNVESFISKLVWGELTWDCKQAKDCCGLLYDYFPEYFVNEKNEQMGASIRLRENYIDPIISSIINNENQEVAQNSICDEMKNLLSKSLNEIDIGLHWDEKIVVNKFEI